MRQDQTCCLPASY